MVAIIPFSMSFQRACHTGSLMWKGTGIGSCLALGTSPSLRRIWAAGVDMAGNTVFVEYHLGKFFQEPALKFANVFFCCKRRIWGGFGN